MMVNSRKIQRIISDVITEIEFYDRLNTRVRDTRGLISETLTRFLETRRNEKVESLDERQIFDWLYKIGLMVTKKNVNYILLGADEFGYKNHLEMSTMKFKLPLAYKRLLIIQHTLKDGYTNTDIITLDSLVNQLIEENELNRIKNDFLYQTRNWNATYKSNIRMMFNTDINETSKLIEKASKILGID